MTKKRKKKIIFSSISIFLILCFLLGVVKIQNIVLKRFYPQKYASYVTHYAEENNVDPLLIFAIIKAESNFKPDVVSKSNAVGLMQLMQATAEDTAKKLKIEYQKEDLYNPEKNICLGTKYFAGLLEKYGNITVALTAYNAGSGNVDKWIGNGTIQTDGSDAENIPYKETNRYVRKILRDYTMYQQLYKNQ